MTITRKEWQAYIERLAKIESKAADLMRTAVRIHGFDDLGALISYAWEITTTYGEAAAALSADMYDAIALLSGQALPPAEVAEPAAYNEVAKTVQGVAKQSRNEDMMTGAVERLVKRAGADTMLKNAARDGAEFAWIPSGDTCAFCIMLASRGWRRQSKNAMKGGHAEHIHAHCDCTYAVRFGETGGVEGYSKEKYLQMYKDAPLDQWNTPDGKPPAGHEDAEMKTPKNQINAMRRAQYAENRADILAQQRAAYELREERRRAAEDNAD